MPRKKIIIPGVHTFYIPSGYLPLIWNFVHNTDVVSDKKLYLLKVLIFIDSLYIRLKHSKKKKAGFSIKNIHDLLGMNHSDCTRLLLLLQEHKIIFCDKRGFKPGVIPWSYGLEPLSAKQTGFDRVSVKKDYIRKSTLASLNHFLTDNEDLMLYYDEVISKLEIVGIDLGQFTKPVSYEGITDNRGNTDGDFVPNNAGNSDTVLNAQKTDGDFVPVSENLSEIKIPNDNFRKGFPENDSYEILDNNNHIVQSEKRKKSPTTISSIHFNGDFVPDDFLSVSKVTDNKYLPLFRIYDKRFFCRPSRKNPDGRIYTNVTNLKKEFRKHLSIDGKRFIGADIRNCQPLLATILFMRHSMQEYGELKEDVLDYKRVCEDGGEFYEYFMRLNKMEISEDNRKIIKGRFFGECFYSKNPKEEKRTQMSKQFEEKFPTCYEALVKYKGGFEYAPEYKEVPITLQAIEKTIVFGTNIELIKAGIKCFNIFDSIYCTSMTDLETVQSLLEEKLEEWNITPTFNIEGKTKASFNGVSDSQIQNETSNGCTSQPMTDQAQNELENKPDWWQPLEYYESMYGEAAKEMYEGQFDMLERFNVVLGKSMCKG